MEEVEEVDVSVIQHTASEKNMAAFGRLSSARGLTGVTRQLHVSRLKNDRAH